VTHLDGKAVGIAHSSRALGDILWSHNECGIDVTFIRAGQTYQRRMDTIPMPVEMEETLRNIGKQGLLDQVCPPRRDQDGPHSVTDHFDTRESLIHLTRQKRRSTLASRTLFDSHPVLTLSRDTRHYRVVF
jgi:hypothetical protein